jgi:hypothetical protein
MKIPDENLRKKTLSPKSQLQIFKIFAAGTVDFTH